MVLGEQFKLNLWTLCELPHHSNPRSATGWWRLLMPWRRKKVAKYSAQSNWGTITSWAKFTTADSFTTFAMSARHPILVRRNLCLNKPKHQSGANLVCPTNMKEISILSFSLARTLHARYCMTNRFPSFFCPVICKYIIFCEGTKTMSISCILTQYSGYSILHNDVTTAKLYGTKLPLTLISISLGFLSKFNKNSFDISCLIELCNE